MRRFQETHDNFTPDFPRLEAPYDAGGALECNADSEFNVLTPAGLSSRWQRQATMASAMCISVASCSEWF